MWLLFEFYLSTDIDNIRSFAGVHQCNQHDGLERRDAVGTGLPQAVGIAVGT